MMGPIAGERFDKLVADSRRMAFLEAYIRRFGPVTFTVKVRPISETIDVLMDAYPELVEETTEVSAGG